jgi:hypothetical protein
MGSLGSSGGTKASSRAGMVGDRGKTVFSEAGAGCVEFVSCEFILSLSQAERVL